MKLAVSNIAWNDEHDDEMYSYLKSISFDGLEIAPTRIFPEKPYERIMSAKSFANQLKTNYHLSIPSIQSIWFGCSQKIFGTDEERLFLLAYTKRAIDFATAISCNNIVFGCPKNRVTRNEEDYKTAFVFFSELGEYAHSNNTVIALEPNPVIYGTNFITTTKMAFDFVKKVNCAGLKVNVDLGTMIYNEENVELLADNLKLVNHIHISEPNLMLIEHRLLHKELATVLTQQRYQHFVSLEMKNPGSLVEVQEKILYLKGVFS
ncbi:MAG: endonuclease [Paenibacillaceae bacterium]|jgi:sugar phosphate isomerase/epimerase|nr:endonuclease [Paenibacillaceae bacterium]